MAQGKDFCLECNSRAQCITQNSVSKGANIIVKQGRRCVAVSAIGSTRIEFLKGAAVALECEVVHTVVLSPPGSTHRYALRWLSAVRVILDLPG